MIYFEDWFFSLVDGELLKSFEGKSDAKSARA